MKKKIALLLPAFFLALSLGACNGKKDEKKSDGDGQQQQPSGGDATPSGGEGQGGEGQGGEGQGGEGQGGEGQGGEGQGGGQQGGGEANDGRSSEPFATGASMQVGSRYYQLASYAETFGEVLPEEAYKKEGFNAEAGEAVSFYLDGTKLEVFSDGDSSGNNITEEHPMQAAVQEVHIKAGGDMSIYLKHWASGSYTFWITTPAQGGGEGEGQGGEGQQGEGYALQIAVAADFAESYGAAGAITYIYAFKDSANAWLQPDAGNVTIPSAYDHFIVVRMNPEGAGNPGWDYKWNQTADIAIDSSKTMLTITGWGSTTLDYLYE